jgi:hypothetical protein
MAMFSLARLVLTLCGLGWLVRPVDDVEAARWKERRRRFRSKMREAVRELLAEDDA